MQYHGEKDPKIPSVLSGKKCCDRLVMSVLGEGLESVGVCCVLPSLVLHCRLSEVLSHVSAHLIITPPV